MGRLTAMEDDVQYFTKKDARVHRLPWTPRIDYLIYLTYVILVRKALIDPLIHSEYLFLLSASVFNW